MRHTRLAEQLKAWREARGLSQRGFADRAGMVYVMVARLELSQTDPRLSTLERLAAALRIDVVDLLTSPPKAKRPAPREVIGPDGRRGEWYARYWTADEQEKKEKGGTKSAAPDLS